MGNDIQRGIAVSRKREARVIWLKMDLLFIDTCAAAREPGRHTLSLAYRVSYEAWNETKRKKEEKTEQQQQKEEKKRRAGGGRERQRERERERENRRNITMVFAF